MKLAKQIHSFVKLINNLELCPNIFKISIKKKFFSYFVKDLFSSLKIFFLLLPITFALSFSMGFSFSQGLISLSIVSISIAILGGSRYQIATISLPICLISIEILEKYQYKGFLLVSILTAIILIIFGILRLSTVIKYISPAYIAAITIYVSFYIIITQIQYILDIESIKSSQDFISNIIIIKNNLTNIEGKKFLIAVTIVISLVLIKYKIKSNLSYFIYLSLSIIATFCIELKTVDTLIATNNIIANNFILWEPIPYTLLRNLLNYAFVIALIIASKTCISANIISSITGLKLQHNAGLISMGISNFMSIACGGLFVSPSINNSIKNIVYKTKTITTVLMLGILSLLAIKYIKYIGNMIPIYSLSAILIVFSLSKIKQKYCELNHNDYYIFYITLLLAIFFGFSTAVIIGFLISMIFFIKKLIITINSNISSTKNYDTQVAKFMLSKNGFTKINKKTDNINILHINNLLSLNTAKLALASMPYTKVLILYFGNISFLDQESVEILKDIVKNARKNKIAVIVSGTNGVFLETLKRKEENIGEGSIFGYIVPNFQEAIKKAEERIDIF